MENNTAFSVETAEESSGFLLWQVTTVWQREIKATLEPFGLSHSGFVILASLLWFREHETEATQTVIIKHTKLDKMTISKSLKSLQQSGYILRSENENDTRAKTVILTQSGASLATEAIKSVEETDKRFFATLSLNERGMLNQMFVRLRG